MRWSVTRPLREIVGTDALGAVTAADQALALGSDLVVLRALLRVADARRQHRQRLRLVLVLRAPVLAFDDDAGRQVDNAHRRIGFVDVLTAGARRAEGVDANLGRVDLHVFEFVGLGHHRDGARRGMDAPLRLGFRNALHAVRAGFELEFGIDAAADDSRDHFLVAADVRSARRDDLDLPALALGVARVHAKEVTGEQRRLVAAGTSADFQKDIALVAGVLGQQQLLQFVFNLRQPRLGRHHLGFGEFAHFRVGEHLLRRLQIVVGLPPLRVERDHRAEFGVLARELAVLLHVARRLAAGQDAVKLVKPADEVFKFVAYALFHRLSIKIHSPRRTRRSRRKTKSRKNTNDSKLFAFLRALRG